MAKTYAYALAGGLIATFTVSPALARAAAARDGRRRRDLGWCAALQPLLRAGSATVVLARRRHHARRPRARRRGGADPGRQLDRAGVPAQARGRQHVDPRRPCRASISLEEATATSTACGALIKGFPEAETVISQHGRPDDGTDATGFFNAEFFVPLKPFDTWPKRHRQGEADRRAGQRAHCEAPFPASSSISRSISRTTSRRRRPGVKGENSVKVFGNDLDDARQGGRRDQERHAHRAGHHRPRGVRPRSASRRSGSTSTAPGPPATVSPPATSTRRSQAAIGGQAAGDVYENGSDRHFPMIVRLAPRYRESLEAIQPHPDRRAGRAAASPRCR